MTAADSTDAAWAALADGEAGVVLAPEGSDMPGGVDTAAVARDALVFFVGEGSSVSDISSDGLEEIFRGRSGGWEDFGGSGEIRILPRREGSGSIAALERLVGCDAALVTGEAGPLTGDDVIGFALWSECSVMGLADGYKLLAVDGVRALRADHRVRRVRPGRGYARGGGRRGGGGFRRARALALAAGRRGTGVHILAGLFGGCQMKKRLKPLALCLALLLTGCGLSEQWNTVKEEYIDPAVERANGNLSD